MVCTILVFMTTQTAWQYSLFQFTNSYSASVDSFFSEGQLEVWCLAHADGEDWDWNADCLVRGQLLHLVYSLSHTRVGSKINQTEMTCLMREQLEQCTVNNLGEMQEEPGKETPHSAQDLQAPEAQVQCHSQPQ